MSFNNTPKSNRLHIGVFGKRNSGKSSLVNAITNQKTSIVSDVPGTTTDPTYKAIEIHGLGPCVFIDTAGYDDTQDILGKMRIDKTVDVVNKTDIALIVVSDSDLKEEEEWYKKLRDKKVSVIFVINKADVIDTNEIRNKINEKFKEDNIVEVSALLSTNIDNLIKLLFRYIPEDFFSDTIVGKLVKKSDTVLLVMPQDIQAPKGRLILPQVQTIRDLLDNKCITICVTLDEYELALKCLKQPPKVIVVDSSIFGQVYNRVPKESILTSFSILFAAYKGDIQEYIKGSKAIDNLKDGSKILVAEACTHVPLEEDIGRVKIPNLLRRKTGKRIEFNFVNGTDYPDNLEQYDLIIHCASCMFNRRYTLKRIDKAKSHGVPITNYGITIAKVLGILDNVYTDL